MKELTGLCVYAKPGENVESLLRRFKKLVDKSGIIADFKKHQTYEKPSVKRKRKHIAAVKRAVKKDRKTESFKNYDSKNVNRKPREDNRSRSSSGSSSSSNTNRSAGGGSSGGGSGGGYKGNNNRNSTPNRSTSNNNRSAPNNNRQ